MAKIIQFQPDQNCPYPRSLCVVKLLQGVIVTSFYEASRINHILQDYAEGYSESQHSRNSKHLLFSSIYEYRNMLSLLFTDEANIYDHCQHF